ncbi:Indoleamine 2,3-dioxygenase 1 [Leucoagaricus sp. SymC.cos]|nr:Indoleamine 2,3-dioxygenase 1 [Leucoagaricus sp. SymC.cos]
MRMSMDEAFVGDDIAIRRITGYLERMVVVVQELQSLLMDVKKGVDTQIFYDEIRPWFKGVDSDTLGRTWVFEGRDEVEGWEEMPEASGASAGQSSLIQALDIYLGVDAEAPETSFMSHPSNKSFQERMRAYMPRHHRAFLNHLKANPRPLRELVERAVEEDHGSPILGAYNAALKSLKEFRDAHMIVVALYIIGPARRAGKGSATEDETEDLKGTGGTDLVKFLKGVRDQTADTYLRG